MSCFGLLRWARFLPGILAVAGLCSLAHAQSGAPGGTRLQFSRPRATQLSTNEFSGFDEKRADMERLQQSLLAPGKPAGQGNSMQAVPPSQLPVARPSLPNRRVREMLEKRRDWMFNNSEAIMGELNSEQNRNAAQLDPQTMLEKNGLTPSEESYLNRGGFQSPGSQSPLESPSAFQSPAQKGAEAELPAALREREQDLKSLLSGRSGFETERSLGSLGASMVRGSDFSSFDYSPSRQKQNDAQRAVMDEFRQLIGMPASAAEIGQRLGQPADTSPRTVNVTPPSAVSIFPRSTTSPNDPLFGAVPRAPAAPDIQSLAPQPAGITALKNEPPPRPAPVTPTFTAPRRSFN